MNYNDKSWKVTIQYLFHITLKRKLPWASIVVILMTGEAVNSYFSWTKTSSPIDTSSANLKYTLLQLIELTKFISSELLIINFMDNHLYWFWSFRMKHLNQVKNVYQKNLHWKKLVSGYFPWIDKVSIWQSNGLIEGCCDWQVYGLHCFCPL